MTKQDLINQATDNAHAMWVNDPSVQEDYASEEEFIECMVQNAFALSDALAFAQTQFTQPSQTEIMGTTYIQSTSTYESGGNCSVDFIHLKDGRVLGVSGDCVVLYDNMEDFHSFDTKDRQSINLAKD
jgi:hypothetical protein